MIRKRPLAGVLLVSGLAYIATQGDRSLPTADIAQTQVSSSCHPSYDPCVPIANDVDCAGGRGNGPAYVRGPVRVIGPDVYRLDGDGDGIGCERG